MSEVLNTNIEEIENSYEGIEVTELYPEETSRKRGLGGLVAAGVVGLVGGGIALWCNRNKIKEARAAKKVAKAKAYLEEQGMVVCEEGDFMDVTDEFELGEEAEFMDVESEEKEKK